MRGLVSMLVLTLALGCANRDDPLQGHTGDDNNGGGDGVGGGGGGIDIDSDTGTDTDTVSDTDPVIDTTDDTDIIEDTAETGDTDSPTGDTDADTGDTDAPTGDTDADTGDTDAPTDDTDTGDTDDTDTAAPPNNVPTAASIDFTVDEDGFVDIDLQASDVDGDPLSWFVLTPPTHGQLSGTPPALRYRPRPDFHGMDTFVFQVSDGQSNSEPAAVNITVSSVNDPPESTALDLGVDEDGSLAIVLPGEDVDGDDLSWRMTEPPAHGSIAGTPPNLAYTPDPDYAGTDSFTYVVEDGETESEEATVHIAVRPVNDPPASEHASYTLAEDSSHDFQLGAADVDGDALTWSLVAQPAHGSVSGTPPSLTYVPNPDFHGRDELRFRVDDGQAQSSVAVVELVVDAVNDRPQVQADAASVPEDGVVDLSLVATDVDGDALTWTLSDPAHGTLSGTAPNIRYTPDPDYAGADSFDVQVSDGQLDSAVATVTLSVAAENDVPVSEDGAVSVDEDGEVAITVAGSDPDGDALTWAMERAPTHGTLSGTLPNLTYTPAPDFHGQDSFQFSTHDGVVRSAPGTVQITVSPVNDPPVVQGMGLEVLEGETISVELPVTDVDGDDLVGWVAQQPSQGTASIDGTTLTYISTGGSGSDEFVYRVSDGTVGRNATVSVQITASSQPPSSAELDFDVPGNLELFVAADEGLLSQATHPDGATISAVAGQVVSTQGGIVDVQADGSFVYRPAPGLEGVVDGFTVALSSDDGGSGSVDVNVDVSERVWFVDNTSASSQGTQWAPFATLAEVQAASDNNETIVVLPGDGTTTGLAGISLKRGQTLVGAESAVVVDGVEVMDARGRPRIGASSEGIRVSSGVRVQDLDIVGTSVSALSGSGGNIHIEGVNIQDVAASGIDMHSCSGSTFTDLRLDRLAGSGLVLADCTDIDIREVYGTTIGGEGIDLSGVAADLTITEVDLDDIGGVGLRVRGTSISRTTSVSVSDVELDGALTNVGYSGLVMDFDGDDSSLDVTLTDVHTRTFGGAGNVRFAGQLGTRSAVAFDITDVSVDASTAGGMNLVFADAAVVDVVARGLRVDAATSGGDALRLDAEDSSHVTASFDDATSIVAGGDGLRGFSHDNAVLIVDVDGGSYVAQDVAIGFEAFGDATTYALVENTWGDAPTVLQLVSNPLEGDGNHLLVRAANNNGTGQYFVGASNGLVILGGYIDIEAPSSMAGDMYGGVFDGDDNGAFEAMGNRTNGGTAQVMVIGFFEAVVDGSLRSQLGLP